MPPPDSPKERLTNLLADCHDDPDLFNTAVLGRLPYWRRQRQIADSVVKYRITVAYTGNMVGKDYLVGGLIPWWIWTRYEGLVVVTGPSQSLLGSVTWKETRKAIERSKLPLRCRISNGVKASPLTVAINNTGWGALGYSTTSVERASGQHAGQLLVIGEEASGIPDYIYDAVDGLGYSRLLLILNPLRADGRAVDLIHQAERDRRDGVPPHKAVNAIRIPSTDGPHAHEEKSPWGLADKTWLDDCARRYGVNSLWYRSHVLAEIPTVSADVLISEALLDFAAAQTRPSLPPDHPVHQTRRIAVDLGEGVGRDSTCLLVRDDLGVLEVVVSSTLGLAEAACTLAQLGRKWQAPATRMSYDRLGIGRDFAGHLAAHGIEGAVGYAGEASPRDGHSFTNLRTEAAWKLKNRLDPACSTVKAPFAIPPADWWPRLRTELAPLSYDLVGKKTRLLPKKDWAAILGRSPDVADALIQSFAF